MTVTVHQFACLEDNYGFFVRDDASGEVACIDTPDANAVLRELEALGWQLTVILNTHWHPDHAGGNEAVKAVTGARIFGPREVSAHFPVDVEVAGGDSVAVGSTDFQVLDAGGHTLGHVVYFLPEDAILFAGDTLFPMGCGRIFEGTPQQMWSTLAGLATLPAQTKVYSAHEYTLGNARFAASIDRSVEVAARLRSVEEARSRGEATVPTTIEEELKTNPFLRVPLEEVVSGLSDGIATFARIRAAKDAFKG